MEHWLTALVSASGGGLTTAWIAKLLISNYLKKHDTEHEKLEKIIIDVAVIQSKLEALKDIEKRTYNLEFTVNDVKRDLDNCFQKLREGEKNGKA